MERHGCPAEAALRVLHGRWKVVVLWHLAGGTRRFSELRARMGSISPKVLTDQLRQMERDGLLARRVYAEVPPRVEYRLTPAGRSLLPIVRAMARWGARRAGA